MAIKMLKKPVVVAVVGVGWVSSVSVKEQQVREVEGRKRRNDGGTIFKKPN